MLQACPVSLKQTDETIVRISAFYILSIVVSGVVSAQPFFFYFLVLDFAMRLYGCKEVSIIYRLAVITKKIIGFKTHKSDAAAKRLAAYFGLVFSIVFTIEINLGLQMLLYITATLFVACSLPEILFGYCVGCKIYFLIKKLYPSFME